MNIRFEHPSSTIDEISDKIGKGELVRTSPHIGNLNQETNPHYLALGGLGVQLEMVNSCTVNDRHGRPTLRVHGGNESQLVQLTRRQKESLLPVAVQLEEGVNLETFHLQAIRDSGIRARTSSEFLAGVGAEDRIPRGDVLYALASVCDRLMRLSEGGIVSRDHSERFTADAVSEKGVFGVGQDPTSGLLISVQAVMAAEVIDAHLQGHGEATHIGGVDMVKYTRDEEFTDNIAGLASKAFCLLGIMPPQTFRYVVLDKNNRIDGLQHVSKLIKALTGQENFSQHDTIGRDLRADTSNEMTA